MKIEEFVDLMVAGGSPLSANELRAEYHRMTERFTAAAPNHYVSTSSAINYAQQSAYHQTSEVSRLSMIVGELRSRIEQLERERRDLIRERGDLREENERLALRVHELEASPQGRRAIVLSGPIG